MESATAYALVLKQNSTAKSVSGLEITSISIMTIIPHFQFQSRKDRMTKRLSWMPVAGFGETRS